MFTFVLVSCDLLHGPSWFPCSMLEDFQYRPFINHNTLGLECNYYYTTGAPFFAILAPFFGNGSSHFGTTGFALMRCLHRGVRINEVFSHSHVTVMLVLLLLVNSA